MAKLVFQGHETRGEELHKLLEYLGGVGAGYEKCSCITCYYYINREGYIEGSNKVPAYMINRIITTLEEFESKYPYKVGDKVIDMNGLHGTIAKMSWDEFNCTVRYALKYEGSSINHHGYTALMLNPSKEKLIKQPMLTPTVDLATGEILYFTDKTTNKNYYPNEPSDLSMECPDGFEFIDENGNVITSKKIKLERKKSQYPKTYEECCKVLQMPKDESYIDIDAPLSYNKVLTSFTQLLICRDAYWKLAGEWKPEYIEGVVNTYYTIHTFNNKLFIAVTSHRNAILSFPTEEMRDAFYENFKEVIEECKELL